MFTDSQPTTSHFTISHHTQDIPSSLTIPDIKAKIAELQKQLAILQVSHNPAFELLHTSMIYFLQKADQVEENDHNFDKIPL